MGISMKQEDKELLLRDLCARLPYGVKLHCISNTMACIGPYTLDTIVLDRFCNKNTKYVPIDEVKPYLFPLSSMTEEQVVEYDNLIQDIWDKLKDWKCAKLIDWFNKNHFDYIGLIENGLAIDATGKNIY